MWANTTESITPASSLYTGMSTHARASLRSMDTPSDTHAKDECYKFTCVQQSVRWDGGMESTGRFGGGALHWGDPGAGVSS